MSTKNLPISSTTVTADTAANADTLVLRDASGGITAAAISGSSLSTSGTYAGAVSSKTANFTAGSATDYFIDCTSGSVTVTLPTASAYTGVEYHFYKTDSSVNTVTLTGALGTGTISSQYGVLRCLSNGTSWYAK